MCPLPMTCRGKELSYAFPERDKTGDEAVGASTVHCNYGGCDVIVTTYRSGGKVVSCERGDKCDKYVICPFAH